MPIKVLLADDCDFMRRAIRRTLEEEPKIKVVGEAANFAKIMQMIADTNLTSFSWTCIWLKSATSDPAL